jgi:predicted patatin/cPLA2 family phospholipase
MNNINIMSVKFQIQSKYDEPFVNQLNDPPNETFIRNVLNEKRERKKCVKIYQLIKCKDYDKLVNSIKEKDRKIEKLNEEISRLSTVKRWYSIFLKK